MELIDSEGNEVLRLEVNGECVTEIIEAGDYVMIIHHDGRVETTHPIFITPNKEDLEQTKQTDGLINRFKVVVNMVNGIQNVFLNNARAQLVRENINTLLTTNSCEGCNLNGEDLSLAGKRWASQPELGSGLWGTPVIKSGVPKMEIKKVTSKGYLYVL